MQQNKTPHHDLSTLPCRHLKGIGSRLSEKLSILGIETIQDVLFHLPLRYQDRTRIFPIASLAPGEHAVIEIQIISASFPKGGRTRLLCKGEDNSGHIHLRFFYLNPEQTKTLKEGTRLRCYSEVRLGPLGLEMIHPEYTIITNASLPIEESLTPVYPTTEGLSQTMWRKLTGQALALLKQGALLHDILPSSLLQKSNYPSLQEALHYVHRPPANAEIDLLLEGKHLSQKRLVLEELLAHRLSLLNLKNTFQIQAAIPLVKKEMLIQAFLKNLPFSLTNAQIKVAEEIYQDIVRPMPMLRLLQGDVGSGKTLVAALTVLQAIENNTQAAILAPTELLAEQHFKNFQTWFTPLNVHTVVLTGQMKAVERRETLNAIANGAAHLIIGTHAIFQKEVNFKNLTLIVIDEQHRFGVEQRARLRDKGVQQQYFPHQLIMTATPIPRTLAMSVYADLDCSVIDELPPGRTPVKTSVIPNTRRDEVLTRIQEVCRQGRQVYWVCTLIEESEILQCQAAENSFQLLRAALPELNISLLHGRMKSAEKDEIMQAFNKGKMDLLVATTVIEVGVDVPNASLMIIENAERLGLAQLHQLRGRVGRGAAESFCLLLYQAPLSQHAKDRLAVMRETTDGFKIAERDLAIRGPGEVLGTKQTGDITLRIANLIRDSDLLPFIQKLADQLQREYPEVVPKLIKRWVGGGERFGRV